MDKGHYEERKSAFKSRKRWGFWSGFILCLFFWWTVIALPIGIWLLMKADKAKKDLKELEREFEEYQHEKQMEIAQAGAESGA